MAADEQEILSGWTDENGIAGFRPGAVVIIALQSPREKFWGVLLSLSAPGLVLRGISLDSFDDFVTQVRAHEPTQCGTIFFPMQRVERVELDEPTGDIHSLAQRFEAKTGMSARSALMGAGSTGPKERP